MKSPLNAQLQNVETLLRDAGLASVPEIPRVLTGALSILESVRDAAESSPPRDRGLIVTRLKSIQAKLAEFSSLMRRSETIFQGYARCAGVSSNGYCPVGIYQDARDPSIIDLSV